jgi:hypothetical protein
MCDSVGSVGVVSGWVSYGDATRGLTILKFAYVECKVGYECDGGVWWF